MRNTRDTERIFDSLMGLNGFSKAINSTLDLDKVEGFILERTARLMGARRVLISLLDETKSTLNLHRFFGLDEIEIQVKSFHNVKDFGHSDVLQATVITIDEILADDDLQLQRQRMPFLSDMIFTPLDKKDETYGLLGISRESQGFSSFELEIFRSLGGQAATAWENAHSYKKLYDDFLDTAEALAKMQNQQAQ